jgi:SAM-dependent methyltransferase
MGPIKKRITDYWTNRAEGFKEQRIHEFNNEKRQRWLAELRRLVPGGRKLRVLDLGTGTGFFAFVMAGEGHEATGIDLTPNMIGCARETAELLGIKAEFHLMDAEQPAFEPESFDVLLTRNLTWTLPHLEKAYKAWYKLLAPGGVLINFDADYCRALESDDEVELPENHAHKLVDPGLMAENESITMEVGAYQMARPQWDVQLLIEAGFEKVTVDTGIHRRIYSEIDEFYNPVPIFGSAAYK